MAVAVSVLEEEAARFAATCTKLIRDVIATPCADFVALGIAGAPLFTVRQPNAGIPLENDSGHEILSLQAVFHCRIGYRTGFMKIQRSEFKVFPIVGGAATPLVRYDFVESVKSRIPAAHVQFHAPHPTLEQAMRKGGTATTRGKGVQRAMGKGKFPDAANLHFPVGGRRFRPSLEDLLEMLIVEFGIRGVDGWETAIGESRAAYRAMQLRAAVLDAPSEAIGALRHAGYEVTWPGPGDEPVGDRSRMTEI